MCSHGESRAYRAPSPAVSRGLPRGPLFLWSCSEPRANARFGYLITTAPDAHANRIDCAAKKGTKHHLRLVCSAPRRLLHLSRAPQRGPHSCGRIIFLLRRFPVRPSLSRPLVHLRPAVFCLSFVVVTRFRFRVFSHPVALSFPTFTSCRSLVNESMITSRCVGWLPTSGV